MSAQSQFGFNFESEPVITWQEIVKQAFDELTEERRVEIMQEIGVEEEISDPPEVVPEQPRKGPKPYYEHAGITIYHGDCREVLPQLDADLGITDPPYGIGESYASFVDTKENLEQLVRSAIPLLIASCKRCLVTPGNSNQHLYPVPKWTLAWVVPAGAEANPWGFTCWQPILAYGNDPYLADCQGRRPDIFIHTETSEDWGHPCAKPIGFWKRLLARGSVRESDVVLDPFMGSGTTLRAAKDLGRRAIGIEIEEKYCEIAAKRLSQEVLSL